MQIRELSIPGAWELTPVQRSDDRGVFLEWYRFDLLEQAIGHPFDLRQANTSVSKRGVVRGIHFADVPPGQAKYVTVTHGAVLDFAIDIRVGFAHLRRSGTRCFSTRSTAARSTSREGLGHAFVALTDDATVSYLVSDTYNPTAEHGDQPDGPRDRAACSRPRRASRCSRRRISRHPLSRRRSPTASLPTLQGVDEYLASLKGA